MDTRKCRFILILGEPGCGKTTFGIEAANATGKNKKLVIDQALMVPNYDKFKTVNGAIPAINNLQGWGRTDYVKGLKPFNNLHTHYKHGVLMMDDARQFIRSSPEAPEMIALNNIFSQRRHLDIDIIVMAHGFTMVPPMFYPYVSHLVLFKTSDSIESRKSYINNYDAVLKVKQRVDAEGMKNRHYNEIIVLQAD
jgi:hypothetical protein